MKKFFLICALLFFAADFFCQEGTEQSAVNKDETIENSSQTGVVDYASKIVGAENLPIARFDIDGLKRTKRSYMDNLLADFIGKPVTVDTMKMVETQLQAQNLFDQIDLSARALDDGQAAVEISFKEKWSLLPLPVGYYSEGNFGAGLFLMDVNALGQHCTAIAGGLYSSTTIMGAAIFQRPPAKKGSLGFSVSGNFSKSEHNLVNSQKRGVYRYENYYAGVRTNLLFKPSKATNASLGVGYSFLEPIDSPKIPRINQWGVTAGWGISGSSWNGYFLISNSFNVGSELIFSDNSKQRFAQTVNFNAEVQQAVHPKIRLMTAAKGFFSNDLYVTNFVGRGSSGVTLLPSGFVTPQIFGLLSGLEAVVAKNKFGMLSVYALYEVAVARDWDKTFYACHGPEAGVRLYLAKIAFPAFSMGMSYNINEDRFQYSISGGASF